MGTPLFHTKLDAVETIKSFYRTFSLSGQVVPKGAAVVLMGVHHDSLSPARFVDTFEVIVVFK